MVAIVENAVTAPTECIKTKTTHDVVVLDYHDLVKEPGMLNEWMLKAFGTPDSLGLCVVKNVPNLMPLRERLLILASEFAALPDATKEKYVHGASTFNFGWSHGKETMNGKLDFAKGSYYNNPVYNVPLTSQNPEYCQNFPYYGYPNIWPTELPELEPAFMTLGKLMVDVGLLLSRHIDCFIHQTHPDIPNNFITEAISKSETAKARLLHYFPLNESQTQENQDIDSWCGLHIDHSMLTGLTSAMYIDESQRPFQAIPRDSPLIESQDFKDSGLYVKDRHGQYVKVSIPVDCLAFQIGEASQVASRGRVVATPHLVKGCAKNNIARNTFAVFMQPNVDHCLTPSFTFQQFSEQVFARHY